VGASESEGPGDANRADAVKLIGVVEAFGLKGGGGHTAVTKTVGLNAVDNVGNTIGGQAAVGQQLAGVAGSGDVMALAPRGGRGHVVKQSGEADDFDVGVLSLGDMDGKMGDTPDVVKVVSGVGGGAATGIQVESLSIGKIGR
jgi:hypothetical protein